MVGIKNFGMPSCCMNCPMLDDNDFCVITWNPAEIDDEHRADDCPLVEIKEKQNGQTISD